MIGWDSSKVIGNVDKSYERFLKTRVLVGWPSHDKVWQAFYSGWVMGRLDMIDEMGKFDPPF